MGDTPRDIQVVKDRHAQELMEQPGVVSVGIGIGTDGKPAIIVGIERDDASIRNALPRELDGHPVEVQVVGTVRAR